VAPSVGESPVLAPIRTDAQEAHSACSSPFLVPAETGTVLASELLNLPLPDAYTVKVALPKHGGSLLSQTKDAPSFS
jgi:hypothetical protein